MFAKRSITILALAAVTATTFGQTLSVATVIDKAKGLLSGDLATAGGTVSWITNTGYRATMPGLNSLLAIHMPTTSWSGYTHVDVRLKNEGSKAASLEMDCWSRNGQGWLSSRVVIAPGETLDVSMPLKPTGSNDLVARPSITDSVRFQTASAGSIYPAEVGGFYFFNKDNAPANVLIQSMNLANHTTTTTGPVVDVYGQQINVSWPGKVLSDSDLTTAAKKEIVTPTLPYATDDFGGVLGGKNYGPGAGFRRLKDGGRWYLVTPNGNRFFSFGVNEVGAQAWTPTSFRGSSFAGITSLMSDYRDAWSVRDNTCGFIPYQINLAKKYGKSWRNTTEDLFTNRLKSWGFNSLGTNSWDSLSQNGKLASTFSADIVGPHVRFETYDGRTIHDVFSPQFVTDVQNTIRNRVAQVAPETSHNLGVFVDNELPWGNKESSDDRYRYGLAYGALRASSTYSHQALVNMLKTNYGNAISKLNSAWGTNYTDWTQLDRLTVLPDCTAAMRADFAQFGGMFATQYFSTVKTQLKNAGFNGLYLGCRSMACEILPEVTAAAKANCDVISVNVYNANASMLIGELKTIDCPVLISEFCFGAADQGRVGMPLYPSMTENARVDAYKRFMEDVKTWPNLVGVHWYRWEDFPATGKMDGDNMSMGLLSITDNPYTALTSQTRLSTADYMSFLRDLP